MEYSNLLLHVFSGIEILTPSTGVIVALCCALIFLVISGILSASEVAFSSLNSSDKNTMEKAAGSGQEAMEKLLSGIDRVLLSLLIVNNLMNLSIVVLLSYGFYHLFYFEHGEVAFLLFCVGIISLIILLFAEIIPKIYARHNAIKLATRTAPFLNILDIICKPFSNILLRVATYFNKSLSKEKYQVSVDELSKVLELTSDEISEEKEMLEGIISLYNKTVVEIMTSRRDVADINIKCNFKEVLDFLIDVGYSRIPVYSENEDNIKGILYIKDLLPYLDKSENFRWQSLIRPAFFIPETKKIDDLLEEFRKTRTHLAIVVDEFGGTSGIVTLEDILEEIVGEINDEYDDDTEPYTQDADGSYTFEAKISLSDFFKIASVDPKIFEKYTEEVDTLAGLILELKGDFPENNETISLEDYHFEILEISDRRIQSVRFFRTMEANNNISA